MIDRLKKIISNYDDLAKQMSDPNVVADIKKYTNLAKEHRHLGNIAPKAQEYINLFNQIKDDEDILQGDDKELKEIAKEEITILKNSLNVLNDELKILLLPQDPNDSKNTLVEIRSGTGGNEAALFAENLFRMYTRFCESKKWKHELLSINENEGGGLKEVIFSVSGESVYGILKYESGVHRVQRIPETESNGRIHTSAATVAVLPEAEDVDIEINDNELKIDTYRASGAGGQHVNKTESAIRITHLPTGLVVTCQDESSQHKNKDKAMKVLRSRLMDYEIEKINKQRSSARKLMVSTGDRSAKIRTYNFPQGRITDHRINLTLYKLEEILNGDLNEFIEKIKLEDQKIQLAELGA
jgi:peptide chain release factor 1